MYARTDVDFWSCMVEMSVEQKMNLEESCQISCDRDNSITTGYRKPTGFKISPWKSKDYQSGYWLFSMWGSGTGTFVYSRSYLHTNVTRVDLRRTYIDTFANFRELTDVTVGSYKGRKNVQQYNSRVREKTESRDRGGKGFAFGSLKSQNRLSVYVPGVAQELAVEVQFRGEKAIHCAKELLACYEEYYALNLSGHDDYIRLADIPTAVFEVMAEEIISECLGMSADEWAEQAHGLSRETGLRIAEHHMRIAAEFLAPHQEELPL